MLKKKFWVIVLIGAVTVAAVAGIWYFRSGRKISPPHTAHVSASAAAAPSLDSVRMVILNGNGEAYKSGDNRDYGSERLDFLYFARGNKVLFHMSGGYRHVYFLVRRHGGDECGWKVVFLDEKTDWRDCLCDLKGDGDKRYLVLGGNDFGATGRGYASIHVIDVGNDFSEAARFGCSVYEGYFGEDRFPLDVGCCGHRNGEGLIFSFLDQISYGGAWGDVNLLVKLRFRKGREPEWAGERAGSFPIDRYHAELKNVRVDDERGRELALCQLYSDLAAAGWLKHAPAIAVKVGFSPAEITKYDSKAKHKIRTCGYYKCLVDHNGVVF